jgi:hypothetical protein
MSISRLNHTTLSGYRTISVPFIDGPISNSTGNLYFDSMQIDNYHHHHHYHHQDNQQQLITFTIRGKPIGNNNNCLIRGDRLIDIYNPYCNDITITGIMMNVTDKAEIHMVTEAYLDNFIDIMLYNDDINDDDKNYQENKIMNYQYDLNLIYKINIHHITLTHTLTKQSVLIDVDDYYHVDNDDLIEYVNRYDIDDDDDDDSEYKEDNEFMFIKDILEEGDRYEN